jgi:hypothetical protein
LKDVIAALERTCEPGRVEDVVPPALLAVIAAAPPSEWMPPDVGFELSQVLRDELGSSAMRTLYRAASASWFDARVLGPFFGAAFHVSPVPQALAAFVASMWRAAWRGCGTIVVEEASAGVIRFRHVALPPEAVFTAFFESCAASIEGLLDACHCPGRCAVERQGADGTPRYELHWDAT